MAATMPLWIDKPSPCPTGLAKKLDLLRPTGGSGITWFILHYNSNTLQLCEYAALIDGACDFLRVCTIVFGRPIAKRLVFSGAGPFGPVKADPSRQGAPMVSPISMVGCQRAGRQQQDMPCKNASGVLDHCHSLNILSDERHQKSREGPNASSHLHLGSG